MFHDGIAALRQIGTKVSGDVPLIRRGFVLENHEEATANSIAETEPLDKADIAHVALTHRCVRFVGGIPPQLVQIGINIGLAGE